VSVSVSVSVPIGNGQLATGRRGVGKAREGWFPA
jgi:hypothetical protein